MNLMMSKVMDKTSRFSMDEMIVLLKDKMSQHSSDLRRAFQYYARQNKNKISKKDFRKVNTIRCRFCCFSLFVCHCQFVAFVLVL